MYLNDLKYKIGKYNIRIVNYIYIVFR